MASMGETHGILGQVTEYPTTYSPDILYPIPRALGRSKLSLAPAQLSLGVDWWHCFEVSWLNPQGISQVAMMRLTIPANSAFIVESKSLKLYLNSLNLTAFAHSTALVQTIERDLSHALKTQVTAVLFNVNDAQALPLTQPAGICIDDSLTQDDEAVALTTDIEAHHLALLSDSDLTSTRQILHSHLLRSNCPVTNQPDWGTVLIDITSAPIDKKSLLRYLLSFRQHNGFHEQCVEQIFSDLTQTFMPSHLMVRAWYTRRGGIDINPCRVSDISLLPAPSRINRQ